MDAAARGASSQGRSQSGAWLHAEHAAARLQAVVCDYPKVPEREPLTDRVKPITRASRSPNACRALDDRAVEDVAEWQAIILPADAYAER
jgi:hypothetical protein